ACTHLLRPGSVGWDASAMFRDIVVGTDGSESAGIAVERATELAKMTGATLHIVCAYKPVSMGGVALAASAGAPTVDIAGMNQGASDQGDLVCEHAASEPRREGGAVELHSVAGDAADVLGGIAEHVKGDLNVCGSPGMSGARRFVLGSVPNKVSHHCQCNLLIVDTTTDRKS